MILGINDKYYHLNDDFTTLDSIKFSFVHLQAVLTSIVLKQNVTMLDIVSTRMLGQFGFLAKVRELKPGRPVPRLVESPPVLTFLYLCRFFQSLKT